MMYCSIPAVVGKPHPRDARAPNGGMFVAFSPDGIHWTKHPDLVLRVMYGPKQAPPLVGEDYPWGELNSVSDVLDLTYDPVAKKYLVYSKGWIDGPDGLIGWKRTVVRSESDDFIKWSKAHGIPVGPGRGTGSGSVVSLSLSINDQDPQRIGLQIEMYGLGRVNFKEIWLKELKR